MKRKSIVLLMISVILIVGLRYSGIRYSRPQVTPPPVQHSFSAAGINRVILRAFQAESAKEKTSTSGQIEISGTPTDRAEDRYSYKDTRTVHPQDVGLDFVSKRDGNILYISSIRDTGCLDSGFELDNIEVHVPAGIKFEKYGMADCRLGEPEFYRCD